MSNAPQPFRTILVATDFSEDAAAALDWAVEVARERSARLVLVHAAMVTPMGPEFIPRHERFYADLRAQAKDKLMNLASGLQQLGLVVEADFTDEPAAASILAAAEKHRPDLIVAGTRGLTGWKRVVLGSVAARLVRKARCPVVTVHAADSSRARRLRTILVPTDFSEDASLAVDAASRILGETGPDRRIVLLHVYRYPVILAEGTEPMLATSIEEVIAAARREMSALAGSFTRAGIHVETRIDEGLPWQVILEHARQVKADLIAMGTHGRSGLDRLFLGSTAERVLSGSPCPILTVRAVSSAETDPT